MPLDDKKLPRHESYGILRIGRVQGSADLFGSPIRAHHFIQITITEGSQSHGLGRTWDHDGPLICEVAMSEVQFAEAITTLNCGIGVPCTLLEARDGERIKRYERCPPQTTEAKETREEFKRRVQTAMGDMEKVKAELMALGASLSGKKREQMEDRIDRFMRLFTDSAPFFMECFEENAAKVVATAKAEITAHAELTARNTGIAALKAGDIPMIEANGSGSGAST